MNEELRTAKRETQVIFNVHETFMVKLCSLLGISYEEVTEKHVVEAVERQQKVVEAARALTGGSNIFTAEELIERGFKGKEMQWQVLLDALAALDNLDSIDKSL